MECLEGTLENVIFQSDDNRYCVFRVKSAAYGMVTAVYRGPAPYSGEMIRATGQWVQHARFGRQFAVQGYESVEPSTEQGMERFLASGAVKGIGKTMAARIVEHFGKDTLTVLAETPERLTEVAGIGAAKAKTIGESYAELSEMRGLLLFLETHELSGNYAGRIAAAYGSEAIPLIKQNPYRLMTDIDGIGFKTADRLALSLGFERDAKLRLAAGLDYALSQASGSGHTCLPEEELTAVAARLLQVEEGPVERVFQELLQADILCTAELGGAVYVYDTFLYRCETETARQLLFLRDNADSLGRVDPEQIMEAWQRDAGIELAPAQKEAIRASLRYGVLALTGGPGTGKTTIIRGILSVLKRAGCTVLLAAPTGRAARRLSEAAGEPAQTVHRLLEYNATGLFGKNSDDRLEAQAIIVDEASMLDITLMYRLLDATPRGCRLILVGDVDQLPSVGPGSVLKDIIRSGRLPVVRLTEVFRQADLSGIVRSAHRINRGELPQCHPGSDFELVEFAGEGDAAAYVTAQYVRLAGPDHWQDVQVLAPMHRGLCGVQNLNRLLQDRVNPPAPDKAELARPDGVLRRGDKVMQIRNNYEKEVYNGDVGRIVEVTGKTVRVWFPYKADREYVTYAEGETEELQLAYAMSVHKSQGSEYPVVILALVPSHAIMLQRNLLYTAVTRARERVLLVGSREALQRAVWNDRTQRRYSLLAERLQESGEIR